MKYSFRFAMIVAAGLLICRFAQAQQGAPAQGDSNNYVTDDAGIIPYWLGLGPIPLSPLDAQGRALDVDFLGRENTVAPAANDVVALGKLKYKWRLCSIKDGSPVVDGPQAGFGNAENVAAYFVTYLTVAQDTPARLYWSSGDSGKVLFNRREAGRFVGKRKCVPDLEMAQNLVLRKGPNILMIKVLATTTSWGISARLVDNNDMPLRGIAISPVPPGKEADRITWTPVTSGQEPLTSPLSTYIVAGQIGYLPGEEKMAVATSRGDRKWTSFELHDVASDKVVFTIPKDGGSIVPMGYYPTVTQNITRVFFDAFKTPGRYYLYDPVTKIKSFPFDIKDDIYKRSAYALTRMFYFQRSGIDWDAKYAGKWARPSYSDLEEMKKATLHQWGSRQWTSIAGKQLDPVPHDVTGGWLDAGDPNKYTKNEAFAQNVLLVAYDMNKADLKDGDLNIPESGNGFPDLLDETRFTTDYLMRIQSPDGKVFDRVSLGARFDLDKNMADTPLAEIAEPCSGATLCATGALAYAAAVWQESGLDKDYAKKCLDAALLSWNCMKEHPSPWPIGMDNKPKNIGSIDFSYGDEDQLKVLAAAALLRATGDEQYRPIVETWMKGIIAKARAVTDNSVVELGYRSDKDLICHLYMKSKNPDPKLVADWGTLLAKAAKQCRDDVSETSKVYEYGAGLPHYHWGSTAGITGRAGWMLWWAKNFAPKEEMASYVQAADEYMQFILGRNPSRWTFVSSLQDAGATRFPQVMFHVTVLNLPPDEADKYLTPDAAHPDRIGVMPGYLLGGPVSGPQDFVFDPYKPAQDYVHMEPSIMYQCQAVLLSNCLAHMAGEYRK